MVQYKSSGLAMVTRTWRTAHTFQNTPVPPGTASVFSISPRTTYSGRVVPPPRRPAGGAARTSGTRARAHPCPALRRGEDGRRPTLKSAPTQESDPAPPEIAARGRQGFEAGPHPPAGQFNRLWQFITQCAPDANTHMSFMLSGYRYTVTQNPFGSARRGSDAVRNQAPPRAPLPPTAHTPAPPHSRT